MHAGAAVIVNDRADVARLSGAGGVHVGQDDLAPAAARTVVGADAIVGLSTHTERTDRRAVAQPVDYVAIGPVFGTATKATGYDAVGSRRVVRGRGGRARRVRPDRRASSRSAASRWTRPRRHRGRRDAVAVISDLLGTGDPGARVRAYLIVELAVMDERV